MSIITTPHVFQRQHLERIASSIGSAKEYEGDGHILHDSYNKSAYIKRRHGFLGRHPDFKANRELLPSITRGAEQVFHSQADELSVEQIRTRELVCEIQPLLPLPTSTNTETLDNFRSTGTKEWTAETGHPPLTRFSQSPQPSPATSAIDAQFLEDLNATDQNQSAAFRLGEPFSAAHTKASSSRRKMGAHRQTVTAGPDPESPRQQTRTNNPSQRPSINTTGNDSQVPYPSRMDIPQPAKNAPETAETMQKLIADLGREGLTPADQPKQYQDLPQALPQVQHQSQHRPQMQVSAVKGRPLDTPVKRPTNCSNKRAAPVDVDEGDADSSPEVLTNGATKQPKKRGQPATKKPRMTVTAQEDPEDLEEPVIPMKKARRPVAKQPRSAPVAAAPDRPVKVNPRAAQDAISVASSVPDAQPTRASQRPTTGGKGPPQQSGSATPAADIARRTSHPSTVAGTRIAKTKAEAAEAAVERKQLLMSKLLERKRSVRHPDLGPEFFDPANFTADEKDPDGEPPVRCVCEKNVDDGTYTGDWVGCDNEECRVWQHVPCMGEAVPGPEAIEESKYLCQQCDAWAHRKLISRLRKANPVT